MYFRFFTIVFREILMPNLHPKKIEIIAKHKGSPLTIIHREDDGIAIKYGNMISSNKQSITITEEESGKNTKIPIYDGPELYALHIYNSNLIDLVHAKRTDSMSEKMITRANQKVIIANLKPAMKKVLYFVFKQGSKINVAKGEFHNMGIKDVNLKLAPFFNKELILPYYQIYHIYLNEKQDLIDLK